MACCRTNPELVLQLHTSIIIIIFFFFLFFLFFFFLFFFFLFFFFLFSFFPFFFFLDGSTVQCRPSPPSWTSSSQTCLLTSFFHFLILHLVISICTQLHRLFFVVLLVDFSGVIITCLTSFLLLSILLT